MNDIRLANETVTARTGSELVETWIPDGGFRIERRRVRKHEGNIFMAECLVPRWEIGELLPDYPCARQPCLHRIVADCDPERNAIVDLAGRYGLLKTRIALTSGPDKPVQSSALSPEPLDVWTREIRELKAVGDLYDRTATGDLRGREMLELKINANLASEAFHLASRHGRVGPSRLCCIPVNLRAALWQRFAEELAGLISCARCAQGCSRWFLNNDARSDKQFCSGACRNRAFRKRKRIAAE